MFLTRDYRAHLTVPFWQETDACAYRLAREAMVAGLSVDDLPKKRLPLEYMDRLSGWQQVAAEFDVTNLHARDFVRLANRLFHAGLICPEDYARLSYQPEVFGSESANDPRTLMMGRYLTKAHPDGRRDWLKEYKTQAAVARHAGENTVVDDRLLKILCKLKGLKA